MHAYVGILVAVISNLLIGGGIGIKKLASTRGKRYIREHPENIPAEGVRCFRVRLFLWHHNVLIDWVWWLGLLMLLIGECSNFYAYTIAPAFIVVLLGSISVFTTQCLAFINGEWFNGINIFGVVIALLATTAIITEIPHTPNSLASSIPKIAARLADPFVLLLVTTDVFAIIVLTISIVIYRIKLRVTSTLYMASGHESTAMPGIPVYAGIMLYACVGGLTVITTKSVGILLLTGIADHKFYFDRWYIYPGVGIWVVFLIVQLYLLNALLSSADSALVSPLLYVAYAGVSMTMAGVYFHEFTHMNTLQWLILIFCIACIMIGVWLVTQREDRRRGCFPWCCPSFPLSDRFSIEPINIAALKQEIMNQLSSTHSTPRTLLSETSDAPPPQDMELALVDNFKTPRQLSDEFQTIPEDLYSDPRSPVEMNLADNN